MQVTTNPVTEKLGAGLQCQAFFVPAVEPAAKTQPSLSHATADRTTASRAPVNLKQPAALQPTESVLAVQQERQDHRWLPWLAQNF